MDYVLACASAKNMKYYFNEDEYGILPEKVKAVLKSALVRYCSDVGGVIMLIFDEDYNLKIETISPVDEIGSELLVKSMQQDMRDLFEQLENFAKAYASL